MSSNPIKTAGDAQAGEFAEWRDAIASVIRFEGEEKAAAALEAAIARAHELGADLPFKAQTPYVNTIPVHEQKLSPGDPELEWRIRCWTRWNAMTTVLRANAHADLGGHIASFASCATLYDVGFNHFWHGGERGDLVYFQGHAAPGIYARAFLEGRLGENQLDGFRRETGGEGLSSYPHPWLMPDFWQFPTVSMGLGPLMAIYQARFMRYLHNRGLADTAGRRVWVFTGDGEMDEPESLSALSFAVRQELDNLVLVINCNLQRLDGPVRGNGKIIQELEGLLRGAGWEVIKLIWGSAWDPLFAKDKAGLLRARMEEVVDGEYQAYKRQGGAYTRKHLFGKHPQLLALVENMTDEDIWRLNRGGHDPHKVYAAYARALEVKGKPVAILAKTIKGYGMGEAGEGQNITHQQKKMGLDALRAFRDRFNIPVRDEDIESMPYLRFAEGSAESKYLRARREALGGALPARRRTAEPLPLLPQNAFARHGQGSGERKISTTMAFVNILNALARDKSIGKYIVPIVPDECRTFGMEGLFRPLGIYAPRGQLYRPEDADQLMYYKESREGQILQEGINEAGAMAEWIAAATSYSTHNRPMIPFYIFYSMFGFQRVGDLAWAAGDSRARGFLIGGTSGRTTLNGEGLQHQDGQSHIIAQSVPNCVSYDPAFAYELAAIIRSGLERMMVKNEDIYYYITTMNENYIHPPQPDGVEEGIIRGLYCFRGCGEKPAAVRLIASGAMLLQAIIAADNLAKDWGLVAEIWSAPSFNLLARDGQEIQRWNLLHPHSAPRRSYVAQCLGESGAPVVACSDYMRLYADQIRAFVPAPYYVLGADGFGRSDTREALRRHFETGPDMMAFAALSALARLGKIDPPRIAEAMKRYRIDPAKPPSWKV